MSLSGVIIQLAAGTIKAMNDNVVIQLSNKLILLMLCDIIRSSFKSEFARSD